MESVKSLGRRWGRQLRANAALASRVSALEDEVHECRQLNLRLAELCDVMMELLVPMADRNPERVEELLARYRDEISDPRPWAEDERRTDG